MNNILNIETIKKYIDIMNKNNIILLVTSEELYISKVNDIISIYTFENFDWQYIIKNVNINSLYYSIVNSDYYMMTFKDIIIKNKS